MSDTEQYHDGPADWEVAEKQLAEIEPIFSLLLQKLIQAQSPINGGGVPRAIERVREARFWTRRDLKDEMRRSNDW